METTNGVVEGVRSDGTNICGSIGKGTHIFWVKKIN